MAQKKTYELLAGTHTEDGKKYHRDPKGLTVFVDSENDLPTMFPGKFREAQVPKSSVAGKGDDKPKSRAQKAKDEGWDVGEEAAGKDDSGLPGTEGEGTEATSGEMGEDVTDSFQKAKDNDLKVFHTEDRGYVVKDGDKVLAENLKTKINVRSFLATHLREHAHDDDAKE